MWPVQICISILESLRVSLLLLISLRNVSDGVEASSSDILMPRSKFLHLSFHHSLIITLCLRLIAVGLIVSLRRRRGGVTSLLYLCVTR